MLAREYANETNDEVHSPALGGQAVRLLPLICLEKKREEEIGGVETLVGELGHERCIPTGGSSRYRLN